MARRVLTLGLALTLVGSPGAGAADTPSDPELARGIRLVREGDFEGALLALDAAAQRLTAPARSQELARANLYLGVAYLGLGQEALARAKFRQALALDASLRLNPEEFPPRTIRSFEAAREELAKQAALEKDAKKKRGKGGLVLLGLGGAAAAGIAVAVTGERKNSPPSASFTFSPEGQALVNATRVTFTATASDPEGEPLSYSWDFGDGSTGEGPMATHVFTRDGTLSVALTVRDGLTSTTVRQSLTARLLTGRWRPTAPMVRDETDLDLTQTQDRVTTIPTYAGSLRGLSSSPNGVRDPRAVILRYLDPRDAVGNVYNCNFSVTGQADAALQTITGTAMCEGAVSCPCLGQQRPVTLVRQ